MAQSFPLKGSKHLHDEHRIDIKPRWGQWCWWRYVCVARRKHFMCLSMGQESGGGPQSIYWTMLLQCSHPGQQLLLSSFLSPTFFSSSSWSTIHDIISSMTNICFHIFALAHHKSVCLFTAVFLLPAPPWSARNLATAASFFAQNIPPTKRAEQIFRSCYN